MPILFYKLTSNSSKKNSFLPVQKPPGGLSKNLKTWGNSSYKNYYIPNNLSSQSKIKPIYQVYPNVSELPPPPY